MYENDPTQFSDAWIRWRGRADLDEYENRWDSMEAQGQNVHGEADYVMRYKPIAVLDAGCGMGRVGIELAKRGVSVTGVDLDAEMLGRAAKRDPDSHWIVANLAELALGQVFDIVVMAGNVLPFVRPEEQAEVVAALCSHVAPDGALISGSSLWPKWPTVADYDRWCAVNGFAVTERYAAWTLEAYEDETADYAVSTYRRHESAGEDG